MDIPGLLSKMGDNCDLTDMAHHLQVHLKVFQLMDADSKAAAKEVPARLPMTYMCLPTMANLPMWIPNDAVTGRAAVEAEAACTGLDPVSRLGQSLERAAGHRGFFRTTTQWMVTMLMWGTAAIFVGQWTLCLLLTHIDTIMHLSERETVRNARVGSSIAMFYCELRRQSWDERTRQGDPSLTTIKMVEK